jgi:hypothetical protein
MVGDILSAWMQEAKQSFIDEYNRSGRRASGRMERETDIVVLDERHQQIVTSKYIGALVGGRKPTSTTTKGSPTLREVILEWIDDKGITPKDGTKESLSYAIAQKIHKDGIKVPNKYNDGTILQKAFPTTLIDKLNKELGRFYTTEIIKEIQEPWR